MVVAEILINLDPDLFNLCQQLCPPLRVLEERPDELLDLLGPQTSAPSGPPVLQLLQARSEN